jgi:hypothetical protein
VTYICSMSTVYNKDDSDRYYVEYLYDFGYDVT